MILITCVYAPYTLAFVDSVPIGITILDTIINAFFVLDILINMISAYEDSEMMLVTDHRVISSKIHNFF